MNSHYVPQFILRNFGERVCTFNVGNGVYNKDVHPEKAFCKEGFYTDEIENQLNSEIESHFSKLFKDKIKDADKIIDLSREELLLIKKYLIISVLRSIGSEAFINKERCYYNNSKLEAPFQEEVIEGETDFGYWMRTLKVVLESDGSPDSVMENPHKTYPAYRWSQVICRGFLAFWDSEFDDDEFIITDIGMTSETMHDFKKDLFLLNLLNIETDPEALININNCLIAQRFFPENFMMFPISACRMIVSINPFYMFRAHFSNRYNMPKLSYLTEMDNEELFLPNEHIGDRYIYHVKKLTAEETQYCNALFLDRIDTFCGFSSLDKAYRSFLCYKKYNEPPYVPRVDYSKMYGIIEKKYGLNKP